MAKASQIQQARNRAGNQTRPAPVVGTPQRQPPDPSQLLSDATNALALCEDGMAAYVALKNAIAPGTADAGKGSGALRFTWEAAPRNGTPRPIVTNLGKLPADQRAAVVGPLVNLHFDQMQHGALTAQKLINQLVDILADSAGQAAEEEEPAGDDVEEAEGDDEQAADDEAETPDEEPQ